MRLAPHCVTRKNSGGYLLLESLFAMAVFVIAATAMVKAVSGMAGNFKKGTQELEIARLTESTLAEALSLPAEWMTEDGWEAQREFDGRFTITTRMYPTELTNQDDAVLTGYFKIDVTVQSIATGQEWLTESLRYIPELAVATGSSSRAGGEQ